MAGTARKRPEPAVTTRSMHRDEGGAEHEQAQTGESVRGARGGQLGETAKAMSSRVAILAVWAVTILIFSLLEPSTFLQAGTFQTIFGSQEPLVFISVALLCTFMVGEFDLSVASLFGLSGCLTAALTVNEHMSVYAAAGIAILATTMAGAITATIVVVFGVNAIVTTLAMSTALLGVALGVTNLESISGISQRFASVANLDVLGLPVSFYYGVVLFLALLYVAKVTPLGQKMSFVGANRDVARLAGIRVNRIRWCSYTISGLICGVGGVILAASLGGFNPTTSQNYLLPAFSAVFLGTAAIEPGRFNSIGTFVGIYFLETGVLGLQLLGFTGWVEDVFYGAVLIAAVAITTLLRHRMNT
jgi:ribose transport system permease protein